MKPRGLYNIVEVRQETVSLVSMYKSLVRCSIVTVRPIAVF